MKTARLSLLAAALSAALTSQASVPERAGEVTFLIGEARITEGPDAGKNLRRGSIVQPGQQIETNGNGHLHIRFVDGAAVAVRPMTRLRIDDYSYTPNDPSQNRIRFFLQEGALRSITGKAGEANKDRFRINTPVAAIGIRGTDFNVQTTGALTRASLFQGAIVMSPLGDHCSAASLGPCVGGSGLELNEQRRNMFAVEAGGLSPVAQLVPKRLEPAPAPPQEARAQVPQPQSSAHATNVAQSQGSTAVASVGNGNASTHVFSSAEGKELIKSTQVGLTLETVVARGSEQIVEMLPGVVKTLDPLLSIKPDDVLTPKPGPVDGPNTPPVAPPVSPPLPGPVVQPPVAPEPITVKPIVLVAEADPKIWWIRWSAYADPTEASAALLTHQRAGRISGGGTGEFGILRAASIGSERPPQSGQVNFALSNYEAYTVSGNKMSPAVITHANLGMNFDTRRFTTGLGVLPSAGGVVDLSASGKIGSDGSFVSDNALSNMNVSGWLANHSQQAGYAFQRILTPGTTLHGATAWSR